MLLLSCRECGVNYFSAASGAECPACGAELGPGPSSRSLLDSYGDRAHSNRTRPPRSEYHQLWDLAVGQKASVSADWA